MALYAKLAVLVTVLDAIQQPLSSIKLMQLVSISRVRFVQELDVNGSHKILPIRGSSPLSNAS
ncbi:hypothetical protein OUZ56_019868 [Daphnia magna]|uniref:Uncharacterized protein n=1 Tax=Daphnia magna TaxID=35525 RepID=A0ABQ9ZCW4_9CRUS|nr:hypothetical protein OUZ56_019868 [Daphnia magna]